MIYKNVKGLIYTEKSTKQISESKYCFRVDKNCSKPELKQFIKLFFKVDSIKINIMNYIGKTKRFKGIIGKRNSYKKAIITLKKGQSINFQDLK